MSKGEISDNNQGPEPGVSMDEVRVSSLSSTWMESEHEGEKRTSRRSCGGARFAEGEPKLSR
jgi:hypothetical protein